MHGRSARGRWSRQFGGVKEAVVIAVLPAKGGTQRLLVLRESDAACARWQFIAFQHAVAIGIHARESTTHVVDIGTATAWAALAALLAGCGFYQVRQCIAYFRVSSSRSSRFQNHLFS